jgi:hypothetical protein
MDTLANETTLHVVAPGDAKLVKQFRQILLWPLQLRPLREGAQIQRHWELLEGQGTSHAWRPVVIGPKDGSDRFEERHYNELVTFLPFVQRFLYGEGEERESPMRVFRRDDVAAVRVTLQAGAVPITLAVAHIDLYFFFDIDVVLLAVELAATDLPLSVAQDLLYRLGRAYPAGWSRDGESPHSAYLTEWLDRNGAVLAASDSSDREKYLSYVGQRRVPRIASHWEFLLLPLVQDQGESAAMIRYRQIEYYRMPLMAYLAFEDPRVLTRNDFVRLGLVTGPGEEAELPYADRHVADFERQFCYDRFWSEASEGSERRNTRYLCCGHALLVVGDARWSFFTDAETGVLAQFRHQHFLLFLIAHFQKASLLMFSDQLVHALERLEVGSAESVKQFKRVIRQRFEIFLRFTHRYWFHDISEHAIAKALFHMCAEHLGLDPLYAEVKERIHDMDEYLDSDSLRRQANTVVRLTVVTIFGLVGTITTGFLGMNLIAAAGEPLVSRIVYMMVVLVLTVWITLYTIVKSKRLSDFLDALSDERISAREKFGALWNVFRSRRR